MVTENRPGQMALNTLVSGEKIELMEKVNSYMSMEIYMMDSGQTIKRTVLEFTDMSMERCTRANGKMIYSTVEVLKLGQTKAATKVNMLMAGNMVLEVTNGMMEASIVVTGVKTRLVVLVFTPG